MLYRIRWLYPAESTPPPGTVVEEAPLFEDRVETPVWELWRVLDWPVWIHVQEPFFSEEPPQDEHEDPGPDPPEDVEPEELHEEENCLLLRPELEDMCLQRGEVDPTQLRRAPECPDSFACPNTGCT